MRNKSFFLLSLLHRIGHLNLWELLTSNKNNTAWLFLSIYHSILTLFRIDIFEAVHRWRGGAKTTTIPKICHTYPTIIKLGTVIPYLKKTKKNIWIMWHTLLILLTLAFSHWISVNVAISRNTDIECILVHNF